MLWAVDCRATRLKMKYASEVSAKIKEVKRPVIQVKFPM
jgi:hypothetical protein